MTTVLNLPARPAAPMACDMSTASDTPDERLAAYRALYERALTARERSADSVVLTFRGDARETVEELARREAACCPFLDYRVEIVGEEVRWTITNPRTADDRAEADATLDAFYTLPDAVSSSATSALTRSAISSRVART